VAGATRVTQQLIWAGFLLNMSTAAGQDTMAEIMAILSWSLWWLYLGRWPTHDHKGLPYSEGSVEYRLATETYWLAAGFFGMIWGLQGDLDFFYKGYRLENHTTSANPCLLCPANLHTCPWRDFRPTAAWLLSIYTAHTWRATHANLLPIFGRLVNVESILPDYMHVRYLGTDQYFYGSVLTLLVFHIMGGDPVQNMAVLFQFFEGWWQDKGVTGHYKLITVNMFHRASSSQPKLRGRAGEIRRLGKALRAAFDFWKDPADELHSLVSVALKLACDMDDILDANPGWKLTGEPYEAFLHTTHGFCCLFSECAKAAAARTWEMFDVTVKLHYLLHIAYMSKHMHPKLGWCWSGEHFMKISKQLLASCTRGRAPHSASLKMVDKYCRALDLEYRRKSQPVDPMDLDTC